jgi:carboxylesterase
VSIVGLSMGAAIGSILAAESSDVACLVLISPYLRVPTWVRLALSVRRVWAPFVGSIVARDPRSIQDPAEQKKTLGYGVVNAAAMAELARVVRMGRASLSGLKSPTLVIQSRQDPRVSESAALDVLKRIGAEQKQIVWTETGGHVITVDYGRERVFAETVGWISRWTGQPPNAGGG